MIVISKICRYFILLSFFGCSSGIFYQANVIYKSYKELSERESKGIDYEIRYADVNSPVVIAAIHGGGIEPGTEELALAIANHKYSYYLFSGIKKKENFKLHLASEFFDEPHAVNLISNSKVTIILHGFDSNEEMIYLGGLDVDLVKKLEAMLLEAGFPVRTDKFIEFTGTHPNNICNENSRNKGIQIELSEALRKTMFQDLSRNGRDIKTKRFYLFVETIQNVLSSYNYN